MAQDNVAVVQDVCGFRWKVEQFHRETKQLTGLESSQCRKARIVRNHIGCAILVWVRLKQVAVETQRTIYCVKHDLLDDYLCSQLKSPSVLMRLAYGLNNIVKGTTQSCEKRNGEQILDEALHKRELFLEAGGPVKGGDR